VTQDIIITPLTGTERREYERCKKIIREGMESFIEIGVALCIVRDGELWRDEYESYDEFLEAEYSMTLQVSTMYIDGAKLAIAVPEIQSLEQARAVATTFASDGAKGVQKVLRAAPKQTGASLRETVANLGMGASKDAHAPIAAARHQQPQYDHVVVELLADIKAFVNVISDAQQIPLRKFSPEGRAFTARKLTAMIASAVALRDSLV
jgi:hypothetical protein